MSSALASFDEKQRYAGEAALAVVREELVAYDEAKIFVCLVRPGTSV